MAAVEIEWAEPPAEAFVNDAKGRILAVLRQNPGKWARLKRGMKSTSAGAPWKKLGLEVVMHRTNPGESPATYDLYARFMPKAAPKPEGQVRVEAAVQQGRALQAAPGGGVKPAPKATGPNDFGLARFRAEREARGVGPEGKDPSTLTPSRARGI